MPPVCGNAPAISASVSAPHSASTPPATHTDISGSGPGRRSAMLAGERKIPEPIVDADDDGDRSSTVPSWRGSAEGGSTVVESGMSQMLGRALRSRERTNCVITHRGGSRHLSRLTTMHTNFLRCLQPIATILFVARPPARLRAIAHRRHRRPRARADATHRATRRRDRLGSDPRARTRGRARDDLARNARERLIDAISVRHPPVDSRSRHCWSPSPISSSGPSFASPVPGWDAATTGRSATAIGSRRLSRPDLVVEVTHRYLASILVLTVIACRSSPRGASRASPALAGAAACCARRSARSRRCSLPRSSAASP